MQQRMFRIIIKDYRGAEISDIEDCSAVEVLRIMSDTAQSRMGHQITVHEQGGKWDYAIPSFTVHSMIP